MIRLLAVLMIPASGLLCLFSGDSDLPLVGFGVIALILGALFWNWSAIRARNKRARAVSKAVDMIHKMNKPD